MLATTTDRQVIDYIKNLYKSATRTPRPLESLIGGVGNMDAADYLRQFPDNSVKLILTDEPYGQATTKLVLKGRKKGSITTDFDWGYVTELPECFNGLLLDDKTTNPPRLPTHIYTDWVFEAYRVLEEHGHLVNFGMLEWAGTMRDVCQHAGFTWRASGPWIKTTSPPHFRKNNLRSSHETFFIASKGSTKGHINFLSQQEMVNFSMETRCPHCNTEFPVTFSSNYDTPEWFEHVEWAASTANLTRSSPHPTEKPEWLLSKFIQIYSFAGDLVVDPFGGSGGTVAVANKLGRRWATNDLTFEWFEYIIERMKHQVQTWGD